MTQSVRVLTGYDDVVPVRVPINGLRGRGARTCSCACCVRTCGARGARARGTSPKGPQGA
eukprot:3303538-Prymnesium_polylepis.1